MGSSGDPADHRARAGDPAASGRRDACAAEDGRAFDSFDSVDSDFLWVSAMSHRVWDGLDPATRDRRILGRLSQGPVGQFQLRHDPEGTEWRDGNASNLPAGPTRAPHSQLPASRVANAD